MSTRKHPDFFEQFTCIADKCPLTCCQEWKIAVDEETNQRWRKLSPPETVSVQKRALSEYTIEKDGERVIGLDAEHRCPFLSEHKLCRLVTTYGDEVLSETCTVFPREVHVFESHEEETLMPCCPAVIDLWREAGTVCFPEAPGRKDGKGAGSEEILLLQIRGQIIRLIQNEQKSLREALLESFYILLELHKETLSENLVSEYFSNKILEELETAVREVEIPLTDTMAECNELLQDLAVNYRREGLYQSFLEPVVKEAETLFADFDEEALTEKWDLFQAQLANYEALFRCYLGNEIFSDLVMPEGDLEQMITQLQWIAMEFVAIRQSLFLKWLQEGCGDLSFETVRDYVVVISRMTGYDEEDVREYLENSFETLLWDWGYFALIVGKGQIDR